MKRLVNTVASVLGMAAMLSLLLPTTVFAQSEDTDGAVTLCGIAIGIVVLVTYIAILDWVIKDAKKRGARAGCWFVIVLLFGVFGILVYLVARPKGKLLINGTDQPSSPAPQYVEPSAPAPRHKVGKGARLAALVLALVIVAAGAVLLLPATGLKLPAFLSNLVHVTGMSSGGEKPAVAIDGSIVFASPHKGGQYADIYLLDAQGTRRLAGAGFVNQSYPVWSPDGTQIAYITDKWQLAVVKSDGSGGAFLTPETSDPSLWPRLTCVVTRREHLLLRRREACRDASRRLGCARAGALQPQLEEQFFWCLCLVAGHDPDRLRLHGLLVLRGLSLRCGERRVADAP